MVSHIHPIRCPPEHEKADRLANEFQVAKAAIGNILLLSEDAAIRDMIIKDHDSDLGIMQSVLRIVAERVEAREAA